MQGPSEDSERIQIWDDFSFCLEIDWQNVFCSWDKHKKQCIAPIHLHRTETISFACSLWIECSVHDMNEIDLHAVSLEDLQEPKFWGHQFDQHIIRQLKDETLDVCFLTMKRNQLHKKPWGFNESLFEWGYKVEQNIPAAVRASAFWHHLHYQTRLCINSYRHIVIFIISTYKDPHGTLQAHPNQRGITDWYVKKCTWLKLHGWLALVRRASQHSVVVLWVPGFRSSLIGKGSLHMKCTKTVLTSLFYFG